MNTNKPILDSNDSYVVHTNYDFEYYHKFFAAKYTILQNKNNFMSIEEIQ